MYHLGGIMFASQLQKLCNYVHKTQFWRDVRELEDAGLIERIKYHNQVLIKIKAFAIKKILEKQKVESIAVSGYRIVKNAMIAEIVLQKYKPDFEQLIRNVEIFSNYYNSASIDLIYRHILLLFKENNMDYRILENAIKSNNLKDYKNRGIYLDHHYIDFDKRVFHMNFCILDLYDNINVSKLSGHITDILQYHQELLSNNFNIKEHVTIQYRFTLYTTSDGRKVYAKSQFQKVKESLEKSKVNILNTKFAVTSLNITDKLFNGSKVIL